MDGVDNTDKTERYAELEARLKAVERERDELHRRLNTAAVERLQVERDAAKKIAELEAGAALERRVGSWLAGALIYQASTGRAEVPDFFASDDDARADIERCAAAVQP